MDTGLNFCIFSEPNTFYWANYWNSDGGDYALRSCYGLRESDDAGTCKTPGCRI